MVRAGFGNAITHFTGVGPESLDSYQNEWNVWRNIPIHQASHLSRELNEHYSMVFSPFIAYSFFHIIQRLKKLRIFVHTCTKARPQFAPQNIPVFRVALRNTKRYKTSTYICLKASTSRHLRSAGSLQLCRVLIPLDIHTGSPITFVFSRCTQLLIPLSS